MPSEHDVIVVGGGIGGIIGLHYARQAGLRAVVLERDSKAGGLWTRLPDWQDIQNRSEDWTLGTLPIGGETRADIEANIQSWVAAFDLAPSIRLTTPALSAVHEGAQWRVVTPAGDFVAPALISATGVHNSPVVPEVQRHQSQIEEFHSSALHDPTMLRGKRVMVVGGGASGFDLLDLCLEHAASSIDWVYRSLRWMAPTNKAKRFASNVRQLAKEHMNGVSNTQLSRALDGDLRLRYRKFDAEDILPDEPFDLDRHQLIPGRWRMLANLAGIARYRSEITRIEGKQVTLRSGETRDVDVILWGTGYDMDLSYLHPLAPAQVKQSAELAARCGSLVVSLDAPQLYFLSVNLGSTNATPWLYCHLARAIVAQICQKATLSPTPIARLMNYFDLPTYLAPFDPDNYRSDWREDYTALVTTYPNQQPLPIPATASR